MTSQEKRILQAMIDHKFVKQIAPDTYECVGGHIRHESGIKDMFSDFLLGLSLDERKEIFSAPSRIYHQVEIPKIMLLDLDIKNPLSTITVGYRVVHEEEVTRIEIDDIWDSETQGLIDDSTLTEDDKKTIVQYCGNHYEELEPTTPEYEPDGDL